MRKSCDNCGYHLGGGKYVIICKDPERFCRGKNHWIPIPTDKDALKEIQARAYQIECEINRKNELDATRITNMINEALNGEKPKTPNRM